MSHRALITGVSGFAGTFLAEHLLKVGDAVAGCSPDGAWLPGTPQTLEVRVEMIRWDLALSGDLPQETRRRIDRFRPDVIYHLAALSVPEDCGHQQPTPLATAVNVEGTRRVLQLALSLPSSPRVLFVSTSQVYARVPRQSPRVDENAPLGPKNGYGVTKLLAEREVARAVQKHGCDAIIVRAFQHAGPRQNPRMMLSQWARQFASGTSQPVEVYTRDAQIDLTDVRDVVRAYRLLVLHGRRGQIYNVGSGRSRRSGDVLDTLRQLADPDRPIIETRPGFKQDPIAEIIRLVRTTGWQPVIPVERTVADTLSWWREQIPRSDME